MWKSHLMAFEPANASDGIRTRDVRIRVRYSTFRCVDWWTTCTSHIFYQHNYHNSVPEKIFVICIISIMVIHVQAKFYRLNFYSCYAIAGPNFGWNNRQTDGQINEEQIALTLRRNTCREPITITHTEISATTLGLPSEPFYLTCVHVTMDIHAQSNGRFFMINFFYRIVVSQYSTTLVIPTVIYKVLLIPWDHAVEDDQAQHSPNFTFYERGHSLAFKTDKHSKLVCWTLMHVLSWLVKNISIRSFSQYIYLMYNIATFAIP